jgi:hypothetical protein
MSKMEFADKIEVLITGRIEECVIQPKHKNTCS